MMNREFLVYRTFPDGREKLLHAVADLICEFESGAMESLTDAGFYKEGGR